MPRKVNGLDPETEKLITTAAIIAGVFFGVVRPILASLGVDPASQEALAEQNTADPASNPFSTSFEPYSNWLIASGVLDTGSSTQEFYTGLKGQYDAGTLPTTSPWYNIAAWAEMIYGSYGFFHLMGNNNDVVGVFSQLSKQVQVSAIADYFAENWGKDLYTFIKGGDGYLLQGLTASEMADIIAHVNSLPVQ